MAEGRPKKIIFDLPTQIDNRFAAAFDTRLVEATTDSWHSWFGLLEIYAEKCGHARVIKRFETTEGFKLGQWVNSQRSRRDLLTDDKIARLESLQGWVWDILVFQWEVGYAHLQDFVGRDGHARVPALFKTVEGYSLGVWVNIQRSKKGQLSDGQIARLESLSGWVWDVLTYKWEQGYAYLQAFVEREECARFLLSYKTADGYALGIWVGKQKKNKDRLSDDRIARLESLPGWEWKA